MKKLIKRALTDKEARSIAALSSVLMAEIIITKPWST